MNLKIQRSNITLREICIEKLSNAIITGYFHSGERLIERKLCEELDVSRTVVRESLRHLQAEGLVENLPNKGPIVAVLNWEIAKQIYKIRLLLEQDAVFNCVLNLSENNINQIKLAQENLKNSFLSNDIIDVLNASNNLYKLFFEIAEHNIAWNLIKNLNARISRLRVITLTSKDRKMNGYERIKNICEAIYLYKNPQLAKDYVAEHINEITKISEKILDNKVKM